MTENFRETVNLWLSIRFPDSVWDQLTPKEKKKQATAAEAMLKNFKGGDPQ